MLKPCVVCDQIDWQPFTLPTTQLVRSDCRAIQGKKTLLQCLNCGLVNAQHRIAPHFYADYDLDEALLGQEQLLFSDYFPEPRPRSALLLSLLQQRQLLPDSGRSLDMGCNHGFFSFHLQKIAPKWQVYGYEPVARPSALRDQHLPAGHFFQGNPIEIPGHYDLISLIHVLEHIEDPLTLLYQLKASLTPAGRLLIQVPDYTQTAYDLIIYDHLFHFNLQTLTALLQRAGFEIILAESLLNKELTLLCRVGQPMVFRRPAQTHHPLQQGVQDLKRITEQAHHAAALARTQEQPLMVMGTAIAAAYISGQLQDQITAFMDESPLQQTRHFRGKPILNPDHCPLAGVLFLPFPAPQAQRLQARLQVKLPAWKIIY